MTWREHDEGPSEADIDRFGDGGEDFDDGLFPDERAHGPGDTKLRWNNARIAVIAGILLIAFFVFLANSL